MQAPVPLKESREKETVTMVYKTQPSFKQTDKYTGVERPMPFMNDLPEERGKGGESRAHLAATPTQAKVGDPKDGTE